MSRLLVIAGLLFSLHASARADFVRYHCHGPTSGSIRVIADDACRGFFAGKKQHMFSRIVSGTLLASKDGKTVVLIEDYLSGSVDAKRKVVTADIDSEQIDNPTVVQIWRDGARVAFYDIARLAKDVTKLEESTSHVQWVAALPTSVDGPTFTLTTTSGRRITFDAKTGAITGEEDAPAKRP